MGSVILTFVDRKYLVDKIIKRKNGDRKPKGSKEDKGKGRIKQIENDLYEKFCLRFQIKDPTDN